MATGSFTWRKTNATPNFKKGKEAQAATSQFHLNPCEDDGTGNPENHFQVH